MATGVNCSSDLVAPVSRAKSGLSEAAKSYPGTHIVIDHGTWCHTAPSNAGTPMGLITDPMTRVCDPCAVHLTCTCGSYTTPPASQPPPRAREPPPNGLALRLAFLACVFKLGSSSNPGGLSDDALPLSSSALSTPPRPRPQSRVTDRARAGEPSLLVTDSVYVTCVCDPQTLRTAF